MDELPLTRGMRRISNAVSEDGSGMGSHAVIIDGVRHGLSGGSRGGGGGGGGDDDDGDDKPDGSRGRAMLGAGAFELAAAAVVSHAGRRSRIDDAAAREKARRTEVGLRAGHTHSLVAQWVVFAC